MPALGFMRVRFAQSVRCVNFLVSATNPKEAELVLYVSFFFLFLLFFFLSPVTQTQIVPALHFETFDSARCEGWPQSLPLCSRDPAPYDAEDKLSEETGILKCNEMH